MCRSCACKLRPQSAVQITGEERAFKKIIKDRAKKAGIEVSMLAKEFIEIATQNCFYCGDPPFPRPYLSTRGVDVYLNGLDRSDNSLGYTKENCVACCKKCNTAKGKMSPKEFKEFVERIYRHFVSDERKARKNND